MKYQALKQKHNALEQEIFDALLNEIVESEVKSEFVNGKALKVNVFDYVELVFVNDRLTFLDENGHHYDLYTECTLEDLVDILTKL